MQIGSSGFGGTETNFLSSKKEYMAVLIQMLSSYDGQETNVICASDDKQALEQIQTQLEEKQKEDLKILTEFRDTIYPNFLQENPMPKVPFDDSEQNKALLYSWVKKNTEFVKRNNKGKYFDMSLDGLLMLSWEIIEPPSIENFWQEYKKNE